MNVRARLLALLLSLPGFLCIVFAASTAFGEADPSVEMARQRFKEGVQYYDQRDYDKARLAFLQAYAIKPHPAVLLNLAQSELRAGHTADAASHFSQYLRENKEASAAERQEAELGFTAARAKVAEVKLEVDTEGAEVTVDGDIKGRSPLAGPLYMSPGTHTIEARAGDVSGRTSVTVAAGQSTSSSLRLTQAAPGPAKSSGAQPAETSTAAPPPVEPPETETEEEPTGPRQSFPSWFAERPLAWVGAGLMVVGFAGGAAFAIAAGSDYDKADQLRHDIIDARDADRAAYTQAYNTDPTGKPIAPEDFFQEPPCDLGVQTTSVLTPRRVDQYEQVCADWEDRADAGDTKKTVAIVGIVAGSIGAVITIGHVVYYFMDTPAESSGKTSPGPRFAVAPLASPTLKGLSISGSF